MDFSGLPEAGAVAFVSTTCELAGGDVVVKTVTCDAVALKVLSVTGELVPMAIADVFVYRLCEETLSEEIVGLVV